MLLTIQSTSESKKNFRDMKLEPWVVVESEVSSNVQNILLKDKDLVKVLIAGYREEDPSFRQDTMSKAQSVEKNKFLPIAIS